VSRVGQVERETQKRVVALFAKRLGYTYGGFWADRVNAGVEQERLRANLIARGYHEAVVTRAVHILRTAAAMGAGASLYEVNRKIYELLRYGVKVKLSAGDQVETVRLIDWEHPENNDFLVAEEVTVAGEHTKRPDIVLYVNGIALAVIELKRSRVGVSEGIRQHIGNQQQHFIRPFFSTVQLLFAGNDVEGLRYGVIETPEKYWLEWKEPAGPDAGNRLDQALLRMCAKDRFLELIHDFIVFDSGVKKTARHNQYFGVKAAQHAVAERRGGIIWHTQGSGKSLLMVWLAKWIRENVARSRVLIVTDRTELDEQIEKVFGGVSERIYRTTSGNDLVRQLGTSVEPLICSLVHKFDGFLGEVRAEVPSGFRAKGDVFVFVDEAHRTQSGVMHDAMKELLPDAVFLGFTGTPLLKADKKRSIDRFGPFIHEYRFDEAVADRVVLDLRYEARDVDQELKGAQRIDQWFESKTEGLTEFSRARLKKRWGTMQKVASTRSRGQMIVQDILMDFDREPRLVSGRGNAILVSDSIYQACRYYEMFTAAGFKDKVAIVTSYVPSASAISKEDAGEGKTEKLRQYEIYRQMLADYFREPADEASTDRKVARFEREVKERFIREPGQMRLLIVVDKLLTGFDAPSATYLYIDKRMQDHGLFQAICRVNRLDGDDKTYGYIVDYRDLFKSLESAVTDYTSGPLDGYAEEDVDGLLKDRHEQDRADLEAALERIRALCEPVAAPRESLDFQHWFVSDPSGDAEQIAANQPKRVALYRAVSALVRAYGTVANDLEPTYGAAVRAEVKFYVEVRDEVENGAGDRIDMKRFEPGMRALLDTYIQADPVENVATFDKGLVQLIVERGENALDDLPAGIRSNPDATAETIVNNVRRTIVDEFATNPAYYTKMSALLDALLLQRRQESLDYRNYLDGLLALATSVGTRETGRVYPGWVTDGAQRALVDFGFTDEALPVQVDAAVKISKYHDWVGNPLKEKAVARALRKVLPPDFDRFDELFDLVRARDEYR
jgi:type I restriction enzyme R subunit